eukprot:1723583-Rhodomonas_salina.1
MELNVNQPQQTQNVPGMFPVQPRAAVAIAACRFLESGNVEWLLIQRGKEPNYGEWSLPGQPSPWRCGREPFSTSDHHTLFTSHSQIDRLAITMQSTLSPD